MSAVRMVLEHGASITGMGSDQLDCLEDLLHNRDLAAMGAGSSSHAGPRRGGKSEEHQRIKERERENREIWLVNEILRKASANFARAELDHRFKP